MAQFPGRVHRGSSQQADARSAEATTITKGKGASASGSWQPIEGNYQLAWQILCEKYNDDYALKQALVAQIMKIPRCHDDNVDALTVLVENTANSIRQLASMNVPTDQWGELLTGLITWKMPGQLAEHWEQKRVPNQEPTFQELIIFPRHRIRRQSRGPLNWSRNHKRTKPTENDGASDAKKPARDLVHLRPRHELRATAKRAEGKLRMKPSVDNSRHAER